MRELFAGVQDQGQTTAYLQHVYETDKATHAYLLAGGTADEAVDIAMRFAAAVIAREDDTAYADVLRGVHPDLHVFAPGGVGTYLVEQIRELTHDAELAPIRSSNKVYILKDAHRLAGAPANALLKTLEEPPGNVICILIANNEAAVLETLRSRCEVLSLHTATQRSSADPRIIGMIDDAARGCDNRTLLAHSAQLIELVKEKAEQMGSSDEDPEGYIEKYNDYLTQGAKTQIKERAKRETTANERTAYSEQLATMRSWLRDCLVMQQGTSSLIAYPEYARQADLLAQTATTAGLLCAIDAVATASSRISYNVKPQFAVEAMFLEIREALCRR